MHDQLAEKSRADIQHLNMKKPDLVERRETVRAKDLGEHYRGITSTENLSNRVTRLPNEEAPEASQVKRMFSSDSLTSETQQKVDVVSSPSIPPRKNLFFFSFRSFQKKKVLVLAVSIT